MTRTKTEDLSRSQKIAAKNIDGELARLRDIVADLQRELDSPNATPEAVLKLGDEILGVGAQVVMGGNWWRKTLDELAVLPQTQSVNGAKE